MAMDEDVGLRHRRRTTSPARTQEEEGRRRRRSRAKGFAWQIAKCGLRLADSAFGVQRVDAKHDVETFSREFREKNGDRALRFLPDTYREALRKAHREHKFLLVYLHAHEHEDVPTFVENTLADPVFASFVAGNFVCWGGDVRTTEANKLSWSLGATAYPFMALLMSHSSTRTSVILKQKGKCEKETVLEMLMRANEEQGAMLVALRAEEEERVRNRQLREEQDAAYLASLEADRKREEEMEEARRREEEESRRIQEEEERVRAEQLEEERRIQEKAKERERIRAEKAKKVTEEPEDGPGITSIAIKLPDGSRKLRKFHGSATVEQLYDYVDSLEELHSVQYQLHSNFPREAYGRILKDKTLEEVPKWVEARHASCMLMDCSSSGQDWRVQLLLRSKKGQCNFAGPQSLYGDGANAQGPMPLVLSYGL